MRTRTALILTSILWSVPYVLLATAGGIWLWERGFSLWWLVLAAVCTLSAKVMYRRTAWQGKKSLGKSTEVEPSPLWTPAGQRAWAQIQKLADDPSISAARFNRPDELWELLNRILMLVAREYYPRSSKPELEVSLPRVMLVVELVARDLKELLQKKVPGSHFLTLHDLQRLQSVAAWAPVAGLIYRMAMFAANPASGLMREIGSYAQGELLEQSKGDLQEWLLQLAIKKTGFYAIEMYSGHLELRDLQPGELTSRETEADADRAQSEWDAAKAEPLRILVLGQVKAGKSSLINELFGELRAADDVVPRTRSLTPYLLQREGEWSAVIFDSPGYSEGVSDRDVLRDLAEEAGKADLLLWVCSAVVPAREPDRRLIEDLRREIEANPNQEFPPVLVVVTHIDLLRPLREWSPPYDLRNTENIKSRNIREVLENVAKELRIPLDRVIPVCLKEGQVYNVEEGVLGGLMTILPAARRLQCQRCLREHHDAEKWQRVWSQAREAGQVLLNLIQGTGSERWN